MVLVLLDKEVLFRRNFERIDFYTMEISLVYGKQVLYFQ